MIFATFAGVGAAPLARGALDVADEGVDRCAFAGRHGVLLEALESWSGKGGDILATTHRAVHLCDTHGYATLFYDSDGLGAGVRGDMRAVNEPRRDAGRHSVEE